MFLLVESSDHVTGLTGATATVNLSKAGGTFAAAGGTITEVANGFYKIALTTTDTNTLGDLAFHITATSADPTDFVDQVTANILGDTLPANATQINGVSASSVTTINANLGTTQPVNFTGTGASALAKTDVTDWKAATAPAMTGDAFARLGAPTGVSISADIAAVKTDTAAIKAKTDSLTFTVAGVADSNVVDWKGSAAPANTGDAYARLGAPAGASVSADIAAVKTDTANIGTAGAGLTALGDTRIANLDANVSSRAAPSDILTTALTESYATLHSAPTLTQLLLEIRAHHSEKSTTGTTTTLKKIDGSTSAMTFTLDSSSAPTSITRAT